jgi:DNA (cytosine-5)-methyltransferase 1
MMVATARAAGHDVRAGDVAATDPLALTEGQRCNGFISSPPCPSFSIAGKKLGRDDLPLVRQVVAGLADGRDTRTMAAERMHDPRSLLTAEPMRWIHALDPDWIALEQVPSVMPIWQDMTTILQARGYSAWSGILSAECYGVPQTRQRAILLASKDRQVGEPAPTHRRFYAPRDRRAMNPPDGHLPIWRSMASATGWAPDDLIGFARRNDRDDGHTHRVRDLRLAELPAFALTEKARSWMRVHRGETTRVSIEDASTLQGFPAGYPWQGSRTKQFASWLTLSP